MSFSEVVARGSGSIAARLVIEAFPYEFVTHASMASSSRIHGMLLDGVRFGHAIDVVSGKLSAKGMTLEFVDTNADRLVSKYLGRGPSVRTYMRSSLTTSGTTVNVLSSSGLPATGTVYAGTEAISYTGTTSTTLTGATRGALNSVPQAHYTADGASLAFPVVTDWPLTLEGRRVYLYLYNAKNVTSLSGAGELVFRGVISEDAHYDGSKWSLGVDSIVSLLKQQCTGGAGDEIGIRGIYHPRNLPAVFSGIGAGLAGFWETLEDFCASAETAMNAKLAPLSLPSGAKVSVYSIGRDTFRVQYYTGTSGSPYSLAVDIFQPLANAFESWGRKTSPQPGPGIGDWLISDNPSGVSASYTALSIATRYHADFQCEFPRAYYTSPSQTYPFYADVTEVNLVAPAYFSLYLDGSVVPQVGQSFSTEIAAEVPASGEALVVDLGTSRADIASLSYLSTRNDPAAYLFTSRTRFKVSWSTVDGNLGTFVDHLIANGAALCNIGKLPMLATPSSIGTSDIQLSASLVSAETISPSLTNGRKFPLANELTIEDVATPELAVGGMHWSLTSDGALSAKRFRFPVAGVAADHAFTASNVFGSLTYERQALGTLTQVSLSTGYDAAEDEYTGPTITVRDVQSSSVNKQGRTLAIKRKSVRDGGEGDFATPDEAVEFSRFWLGFFGREYWVVRLQAPLSKFDVRVGDTLSLTSNHLPNTLGGFGVTEKPGLVIGVDWDIATGQGAITAVMHDREVRGYAPAFRVSSQSNVSGNIWDVVVNRTEVTDKALSSLMPVGSLVRVRQRNATAPTIVLGTVTVVTDGTNTLRIAFSATWTPSTLLWAIIPRLSDAHTLSNSLLSYVFQADSAGRVALVSGSRQAAEFSP